MRLLSQYHFKWATKCILDAMQRRGGTDSSPFLRNHQQRSVAHVVVTRGLIARAWLSPVLIALTGPACRLRPVRMLNLANWAHILEL